MDCLTRTLTCFLRTFSSPTRTVFHRAGGVGRRHVRCHVRPGCSGSARCLLLQQVSRMGYAPFWPPGIFACSGTENHCTLKLL